MHNVRAGDTRVTFQAQMQKEKEKEKQMGFMGIGKLFAKNNELSARLFQPRA